MYEVAQLSQFDEELYKVWQCVVYLFVVVIVLVVVVVCVHHMFVLLPVNVQTYVSHLCVYLT